MTALHDVDTQRNGLIPLVLILGPDAVRFEDLSMMREAHRIWSGVPAKLPGYHHCCDDHTLATLVAFIRFLVGKRIRQQVRCHFGTCCELRKMLRQMLKIARDNSHHDMPMLRCLSHPANSFLLCGKDLVRNAFMNCKPTVFQHRFFLWTKIAT
jgi:hypothetical protein